MKFSKISSLRSIFNEFLKLESDSRFWNPKYKSTGTRVQDTEIQSNRQNVTVIWSCQNSTEHFERFENAIKI